MFFAFSGGAVVTFAMPRLVTWLGGRESNLTYVIAAGLVGVVSLPLLADLCHHARARAAGRGQSCGYVAARQRRGFPRLAGIGAPQRPASPHFGCIIVSSLAFTMTNKCLVYYVTYYLQRPDLVPNLVPFALVMNLAFAPLWAVIARHTSKRTTWLYANALSAVAFTLFFFSPSRDPWVAAVLIGLISAGNVAYQVLFWAMLPDTVEYNAWKTGQRHDAKVFGIASFAKQLALGINGALLGWLLIGIGYVPNQPQSEATLWGLKAIMALIPLTGVALSAWLIWGYPLDQATHRRMREDMA